ncbi:MAG: hypothetical protein RQ833_06530 [Sphingomonadaceae bacterium]|nr:hypothetical protein [Sphingomonadaceae bacterium]
MISTLRANIAKLTNCRCGEAAEASLDNGIADRVIRFARSMGVVAAHGVVYGDWVDLYPAQRAEAVRSQFCCAGDGGKLGGELSVDRHPHEPAPHFRRARADLNLHITPLTEQEISTLAALERIAARLEIAGYSSGFRRGQGTGQPSQRLRRAEASG